MSTQRKDNSSPSGGAGRSRKGGRRKRRINKKRVAILVFIVIMMITAVTISVMLVRSSSKPKNPSREEQTAVFGIKSIVVEGSAHYSDDQILEASGLFVGQSLFFVNKRKTAENILKHFPYIETVTVKNTSFSEIKISITEATPVGIVRWDNGWLIIGENGKGLELLPEDSDRADDYRKFTCEVLENGGVGCLTVNSRTRDIINTLYGTFETTNLSDVWEANLKSYTDIVLYWKDSIELKIGSDVNLQEKLEFATSTLDRVLKKHGDSADGVIDLRFFTQSNQKAVFTPRELLTDTTTSSPTEATTSTQSQ